MRKYIVNVILLMIIVASLLVAGIILTPKNLDSYFTMLKVKRERFEKISSPRILFIGDSNLAFGIDSKSIQDSLNLNVQNAGLHGGIGFLYMIKEYEDLVKEGDVVVLVPVYDQYYNGNGEYLTLPVALFYNEWHGVLKLSFDQWKVVLSGITQIMRQRNPRFDKINTYRASYFNEYGDEEKHWSLPSLDKIPKMTMPDADLNEKTLDYVFKTVEKWEKKGVKIYFAPPACTREFVNRYQKEIKSVSERLYIEGHPFIVSPEECSFDENFMYDGNYHLNKQGVDKYTHLMIDKLKYRIGIE